MPNAGAGVRGGRSISKRARLVAAVTVVGSLVGAATSVAPAQAASIGGDKVKIHQLEAEIQNQGLVIQALVERENRVSLRLQGVQAKITAERAKLARDRKSEAAAAAHLRQVAMNTYIYAASGAANNPILASSSASTAAEQQAYSGVASGMLSGAISDFRSAAYQTRTTATVLHGSEVHLTADLTSLRAAQQQANAALAREGSLLKGVKGNLVTLIVAAQRRRARLAELAAERRQLAAERRKQAAEAAAARVAAAAATARQAPAAPPAAPPAAAPPSSPPPPPAPAPVASGAYADPLRGVSGLVSERVDQGVDYSGFGPIYAIGSGTVLSTVNGGWPGGTFIAYRLSSGPAAGLVVYVAEDIQPEVSVGQQVSAGTVLGQLYGGPDGMETGWADGSALGETMAMSAGQFSGANSTAFGYNFSQLLQSTGAPGGVLQNNPATGSLPSGWPSF